jgi:hypothetical protein
LTPKRLRGGPCLAAMGTPLVLGQKVCIAARDGRIVLPEPEGGVLWTGQRGSASHASPVAADGLLAVGGDDGNVQAFRGERRA